MTNQSDTFYTFTHTSSYGTATSVVLEGERDLHSLMQDIKLFLLGVGFHPESVKEYIEDY